jgi:hypothetical protein
MKKTKRFLAGLAVLCALALAIGTPGDAATNLAATVRLQVTGGFDSALDLTNVQAPLSYTNALAFANGIGANQADVLFTDTRTIGAAEDLDVAGGALTTAFGATVTLAELKVLIITASTANTGNIIIGGDANSVPIFSAAPTTATVTLKPGGIYVFTDPSASGVAVTAGTGDIIQVAPSATTQAYSVIIMGSST